MRQHTLSTKQCPTETSARKMLQHQILEINGAENYTKYNHVTFGTLLDRFVTEEKLLEIHAQRPGTVSHHQLAWSTVRGYLCYINRHLRPRWGNVLISKMRPADIADWLQGLDLAPKTKSSIKALLHRLFEKAMFWDLAKLSRNPVELVEIRGVSKRVRKPLVLTPEQCRTILDQLPRPYDLIALTCLCLGLRVSEVVALRWSCIDLEGSKCRVLQGTVEGRIGKVKTETSEDEVPLSPWFTEILRHWKQESRGSAGLVFPNAFGKPFLAGTIQKDYLRPIGERMGLKSLGFHSLRHAYRSLLDSLGTPAGIQQKLMRHAQISTTMNTYGGAFLEDKRKANNEVTAALLAANFDAVGFCGGAVAADSA